MRKEAWKKFKLVRVLCSLGPLHMARLTGPISSWVHIGNFSPVSEMIKGRKEFWRKFWKPNHGETQRYNFRANHSFGNSYSCITVIKCDTYDVENTAGKARRCHLGHRIHPAFIPVTGLKCSYGKILQSAYRDPGWKNRYIEDRASPRSHMNRSKILQRIYE